MEFNNLNSSAVKSININKDNISIIFNSSEKEYFYTQNDSNFVVELENTIKSGDSIGKFVNNAIKNSKLVQIVTENK